MCLYCILFAYIIFLLTLTDILHPIGSILFALNIFHVKIFHFWQEFHWKNKWKTIILGYFMLPDLAIS